MDSKDIITLIIAGWGAVLSTILAVQKFIIERKKIRITLIEMIWEAGYKISLINKGHRPITVREISINFKGLNDPIPSGSMFKSGPDLPFTLTDGGLPAEFHLTNVIGNELLTNHEKLEIFVFDTEGKIYSKYEKEIYDEKYGSIAKR